MASIDARQMPVGEVLLAQAEEGRASLSRFSSSTRACSLVRAEPIVHFWTRVRSLPTTLFLLHSDS